jgi:ABC-2 type transport system permease protein
VTEGGSLADPATMDAPVRGEPARSLWLDLRESVRHPGFWAYSGWLDLVVRYRQSRLGLFWMVAPALVYVWGMGSFFSSIAGIPLVDFAAYVAGGWLVFRLLQSVIGDSSAVFVQLSPFILDGHLRLTDFVLQVTSKALMYFAISLPFVMPALLMSPAFSPLGLPLSLLAFVVVVANGLWMGIVMALLGARFRDLAQVVSNLFLFAFLLTPIIWHADSMPAGSIRGAIMRINPLFHFVEIVRRPLFGEPVGEGTLWYVGLTTLVGWMIAAAAYRRYARFVPLWIPP